MPLNILNDPSSSNSNQVYKVAIQARTSARSWISFSPLRRMVVAEAGELKNCTWQHESLLSSDFYNFCSYITHGDVCHPASQVSFKVRRAYIFKWCLCSARRRKCKQLSRYTFQRFLCLAFRQRPRFPDLLTKSNLLGEVRYLPAITNRELKARKSVTWAVQACFMRSCLWAGSVRTCHCK